MSGSAAMEPLIVLPAPGDTPVDRALFQVGRLVQNTGYRFTTVTPDTHAVIRAREGDRAARNLREVFGWNLPFTTDLLPDKLLAALTAAMALDHLPDGRLRTRVRCSTIGNQLFLHSAWPTDEHDSVFFGPDTYRFVNLLRRVLPGGGRLLEIGAGTGAAALSQAERYAHLVMTDINTQAVRFARINAALADCDHAEVLCGDLTAQLSGHFDAIIANPPFIIDPTHRLYRDGGEFGIAVTLQMVQAALPLLAPDGCLVLYTGAPVVEGRDLLADALAPLLRAAGRPAQYEELDVDVFGAELANAGYVEAGIERLAVVALLVGKQGSGTFVRHDGASTEPSAWCWP